MVAVACASTLRPCAAGRHPGTLCSLCSAQACGPPLPRPVVSPCPPSLPPSLPSPFPQGWQSSKLRTKAASIVSRVEVLPPGTFGTGSSRGTGSTRSPSPAPRQLPSGSRSTQGGSGRTLAATATTVSSRRALPSASSASQ